MLLPEQFLLLLESSVALVHYFAMRISVFFSWHISLFWGKRFGSDQRVINNCAHSQCRAPLHAHQRIFDAAGKNSQAPLVIAFHVAHSLCAWLTARTETCIIASENKNLGQPDQTNRIAPTYIQLPAAGA